MMRLLCWLLRHAYDGDYCKRCKRRVWTNSAQARNRKRA
jgi:hypothetical protein